MTIFWPCPNCQRFADDNFNVAKMKLSVLEREENIIERSKGWLTAFFPFPTMFSKTFNWVVKSQDHVVKIQHNPDILILLEKELFPTMFSKKNFKF